VISWLDEKGFGFIKPDRGGDDLFAHASGLKDGDALREGSEVSFEENYDHARGKYRAEQVTGCIYRNRDDRGRDRGRDRDRRRYDSRDRSYGRGRRTRERSDSRSRGRGRGRY